MMETIDWVFLIVVILFTAALAAALVGIYLRWNDRRDRRISPEFDAPEGVRVEYHDGEIVPVAVQFAGKDEDGFNLWHAVDPNRPVPVKAVHVAKFPARTAIQFPGTTLPVLASDDEVGT